MKFHKIEEKLQIRHEKLKANPQHQITINNYLKLQDIIMRGQVAGEKICVRKTR